MSNSINPEVMMRSLNNKLKTLFIHSLVLGNNEIENNFKKLLRKTLISEYLFENYVIAISGLQGVGKSTLMKQLYDIPDEYLPLNIGRGEKLPILITEYNINNFETRVKRFKKNNETDNYELIDEIIDIDEFKSIAIDPGLNDILLDLRVPLNKNIFNIENNKSFLLLPGIESEKNEWQELLEYSLNFSATCIFVFDHTKFALQRNKEQINKIKRNFEKAKPIYVLTFSDAVKDQNEELKKTVMKDLNIPKEEENRVIRSGLKNEIGDKWISDLMSSVHKYSVIQREFRKSQFEKLDKLLRYDIADILNDIEKNGMYQDILKEIEKMKISDFLKYFDDEEQIIREKYSKLTSKSLDNYINKPIDKADELIIEKKWYQKLKKLFLGESLNEQRKFKNNIFEIWEYSNKISPQDAQCLVLNELTIQRLQLHNQLPITFTKHTRKELLGNFDSPKPDKEKNQINEDIINDYKIIFNPQNNPSELSSKQKKAIELMPVLATEFIRINTIYPELFTNNETIPNEQMNEIIQDFSTQKKHYHTILAGIGGIIGVDGAVDGKIDTIPNLLKAIGVTGTAATAAMWVGASVAGGFITMSVIKQMYKMDFKDACFAKSLLHAIKDRHYQVYMENYDFLMSYIRELLKKRLTERYRIDEADARNERIIKSLTDVEHIKFEMRELINEYL